MVPALAGSINDNPFDWLADADPRIGPFFEIMVRGDYYWVPQSRIESLARSSQGSAGFGVVTGVDCLAGWWRGGGIYPRSLPGRQLDWTATQQFSRETAWQPLGDEAWTGVGQRLYATQTRITRR